MGRGDSGDKNGEEEFARLFRETVYKEFVQGAPLSPGKAEKTLEEMAAIAGIPFERAAVISVEVALEIREEFQGRTLH